MMTGGVRGIWTLTPAEKILLDNARLNPLHNVARGGQKLRHSRTKSCYDFARGVGGDKNSYVLLQGISAGTKIPYVIL